MIPRRELVTLLAYLETGSHKAAAHRVAISESTSRQRVSQLLGRVGRLGVAGEAVEEIPIDPSVPTSLTRVASATTDGRRSPAAAVRDTEPGPVSGRTPTPGTG